MTIQTLVQAYTSCRASWFAAGQPMSRSNPLRRRYVRLYNAMAEARRSQGRLAVEGGVRFADQMAPTGLRITR